MSGTFRQARNCPQKYTFQTHYGKPLALLVSILGITTLCAHLYFSKPIHVPAASTQSNHLLAAIGLGIMSLTSVAIACLKKVEWKEKPLTIETLQEIHSLSKWRLASEAEITLHCGPYDNSFGLPQGVQVTSQKVEGKVNKEKEVSWHKTESTQEPMDKFMVPNQLVKLRLHPKDILKIRPPRTDHTVQITSVSLHAPLLEPLRKFYNSLRGPVLGSPLSFTP